MPNQASQVVGTMSGALEQHTIKSLTTILRSQKNTRFQTINPIRYQQAKNLFKQLLDIPLPAHEAVLRPTLPEALQKIATQAGLSWQWLRVTHLKQDHTVLLFMEPATTAQGQGAYLFAISHPVTYVIQAPHQYFDKSTGQLALQFFFEQKLRAVALNTVHRNQTPQSDLAHQANSLFSAFAEAFSENFAEIQAEQKSEEYLLQIHGFSNQRRRSAAGKKADIILSNGSRSPSLFLRHSQERMNQQSAFKTYLYGADINELGGSQNSSLAILSKFDQQQHFIHIELSSDTRKRLKTSRATREQLWSGWQQ